jgi:class 3 adenylate cyclase
MTSGGTSGSATRGFLFADLRGYTAFVERAGAHRAAAMLDRYRELVRAEVGRFQGAEIRTEGDSFYVVFDRASAAIQCGLAIVAAAAEASIADPALPITVGIGVHAGETVETAEGYVGSAVNIAARVCAVAPSNQVLVTDTVRALTAGVAPVQFVPFGSRRLKGLAQPIALHRALPAGSAAPGRRLGRPAGMPMVATVLVSGVLVVGVAVGVIAASGLLGTPATSDIVASETPGSSPSAVASASASASAEPSLGPFPTDDESALLAVLRPRLGDECQRMVQADAPRHFYPDGDGITRGHDVDYVAGVDCALGGVTGPDQAWLWELPPVRGGSSSRVPTPNEIVSLQGSRAGAGPGGQCAVEIPALELWSFGAHEGFLLCYLTDDSGAVVMWTYDDETLVGKATRDDRDMASLLAWWTDVARFGPS